MKKIYTLCLAFALIIASATSLSAMDADELSLGCKIRRITTDLTWGVIQNGNELSNLLMAMPPYNEVASNEAEQKTLDANRQHIQELFLQWLNLHPEDMVKIDPYLLAGRLGNFNQKFWQGVLRIIQEKKPEALSKLVPVWLGGITRILDRPEPVYKAEEKLERLRYQMATDFLVALFNWNSRILRETPLGSHVPMYLHKLPHGVLTDGLGGEAVKTEFVRDVIYPMLQKPDRGQTILASILADQAQQAILMQDDVMTALAEALVMNMEGPTLLQEICAGIKGFKEKFARVPILLFESEAIFDTPELKQIRYHTLLSQPWFESRVFDFEQACRFLGTEDVSSVYSLGKIVPVDHYDYYALEYIKETGRQNADANFFNWLKRNKWFQGRRLDTVTATVEAFKVGIELPVIKLRQTSPDFETPMEPARPPELDIFRPQNMKALAQIMGGTKCDTALDVIDFLAQVKTKQAKPSMMTIRAMDMNMLTIFSGRSPYGLRKTKASQPEFQRMMNGLKVLLEDKTYEFSDIIVNTILPKGFTPSDANEWEHALNMAICALAVDYEKNYQSDFYLVHNVLSPLSRRLPELTPQDVASRLMAIEDTFNGGQSYFIRDRAKLQRDMAGGFSDDE